MSKKRVERAIEDIKQGRMVILVDDEDRENEGDLCMAAECVTPEAINFMAKYGRGLICLTLTEERLRELDIPMMVQHNTSTFSTAFTVSIEAREGVSTGISASDRARTILQAVDPACKPDDLSRPGHIFPLRAMPGGVLVRTGQTEGAVDLARMAGLKPAGVVCEVMNDDGTMARMPDLEEFARTHDMIVVTIADLIEYRLQTESVVSRLATRTWEHPRFGEFTMHVYGTAINECEHVALVKGNLSGDAPLVRVQAGGAESFGRSFLSEGRASMDAALERIHAEGRGAVVLIERDMDCRRLSGDANKHAAQAVAEKSRPGPLRELGIGAQILRDLGLHHLRILSDHPDKPLKGLEGYDLLVESIEPLSASADAVVLRLHHG